MSDMAYTIEGDFWRDGVVCLRGVLDPASAQPFTARPPVEPVTFATLAAAAPPEAE